MGEFFARRIMDSAPFTIYSDYQPAGDQPVAISRLTEGLNAGLAHQTLLGVTGSGKTFTMANVIVNTQRPALIMAPNKTLAAQLYGEFKTPPFTPPPASQEVKVNGLWSRPLLP